MLFRTSTKPSLSQPAGGQCTHTRKGRSSSGERCGRGFPPDPSDFGGQQFHSSIWNGVGDVKKPQPPFRGPASCARRRGQQLEPQNQTRLGLRLPGIFLASPFLTFFWAPKQIAGLRTKGALFHAAVESATIYPLPVSAVVVPRRRVDNLSSMGHSQAPPAPGPDIHSILEATARPSRNILCATEG